MSRALSDRSSRIQLDQIDLEVEYMSTVACVTGVNHLFREQGGVDYASGSRRSGIPEGR